MKRSPTGHDALFALRWQRACRVSHESTDGGWIGVAVCVALLCALCFGVTISDHGIELSCEQNVEAQE